MLTKINSNLVLGNIDHPLLTWNQLKDYIRRAENEEKEVGLLFYMHFVFKGECTTFEYN